MNVSTINQRDLNGLISLVLQLWPHSSYEEEFQHYAEVLAKKEEQVFVANASNRIIGFIHLALRTDYVEGTTTSPVAYLEGIYVEPSHRQAGVARQLLLAGEKWGREMGCREMGSDAELENHLSIEFHHAAGFEEANRVVCFRKSLITDH